MNNTRTVAVPEVKVYGVGVDEKGRSVVWAMVGGVKFVIPTNVVTFAKLAEKGVPVLSS
jgi:hypothetical protein